MIELGSIVLNTFKLGETNLNVPCFYQEALVTPGI